MSDRKNDKVRINVYTADANLRLSVDILGDLIAKEKGYDDVGMDAIVRHLVSKYHWLPSDIRAMNGDDLRLVLFEDFERLHAQLATRLQALDKD